MLLKYLKPITNTSSENSMWNIRTRSSSSRASWTWTNVFLKRKFIPVSIAQTHLINVCNLLGEDIILSKSRFVKSRQRAGAALEKRWRLCCIFFSFLITFSWIQPFCLVLKFFDMKQNLGFLLYYSVTAFFQDL